MGGDCSALADWGKPKQKILRLRRPPRPPHRAQPPRSTGSPETRGSLLRSGCSDLLVFWAELEIATSSQNRNSQFDTEVSCNYELKHPERRQECRHTPHTESTTPGRSAASSTCSSSACDSAPNLRRETCSTRARISPSGVTET